MKSPFSVLALVQRNDERTRRSRRRLARPRQGFIAPFMLVVSLFKNNLGIYEILNNGAWYNFGYLFGLACIFGGGGIRAASGRHGGNRPDELDRDPGARAPYVHAR